MQVLSRGEVVVRRGKLPRNNKTSQLEAMAREYTLQRPTTTGGSGIDFAEELNEQQLAAVTSPPGPSLVIAGAGFTGHHAKRRGQREGLTVVFAFP